MISTHCHHYYTAGRLNFSYIFHSGHLRSRMRATRPPQIDSADYFSTLSPENMLFAPGSGVTYGLGLKVPKVVPATLTPSRRRYPNAILETH